MGSNVCPAWIVARLKDTGEWIPGKSMYVIKDTIKLCRPNTVSMFVADKNFKTKASVRKMPKRFGKEIIVDISDVYFEPFGTEAGLLDPDSITLVLTMAGKMFPDQLTKNKNMKRERDNAISMKQSYQNKYEESERKREKLEQERERLINTIANMAKKG